LYTRDQTTDWILLGSTQNGKWTKKESKRASNKWKWANGGTPIEVDHTARMTGSLMRRASPFPGSGSTPASSSPAAPHSRTQRNRTRVLLSPTRNNGLFRLKRAIEIRYRSTFVCI
jgi:hypothetical protein